MINLLYIVLMAMLALNVSNEVLDGFSLVQESLQRTTDNAAKQNLESYKSLGSLLELDSAGVQPWYDKAFRVKAESDALYNLCEDLKLAIVRQADGPKGDINNIIAKDDLEAAAHIMLADGTGRGGQLKAAIDNYRKLMLSLATDDKKKDFIEKAIQMDINESFESMPVSAAITLLTKLQSDVRYAEGETYHEFIARYKHNEEPYFKPEPVHHTNTNMVARVERPVNNNISMVPHEPAHTATTGADMMNVLYAGYDNPVSFSVSGVPQSSISVTMSGDGTLTSVGDGRYIAHPMTVGAPVTFTVTSGGQTIGTYDYKVRKLPDPAPYLVVGTDRFKGGRIGKGAILGQSALHAAIDDGLLDIEFAVNSFQIVVIDDMGNAIPVASNGSQFSEQQKTMIRKIPVGGKFVIKNVNATGPDKLPRVLKATMEVRIR